MNILSKFHIHVSSHSCLFSPICEKSGKSEKLNVRKHNFPFLRVKVLQKYFISINTWNYFKLTYFQNKSHQNKREYPISSWETLWFLVSRMINKQNIFSSCIYSRSLKCHANNDLVNGFYFCRAHGCPNPRVFFARVIVPLLLLWNTELF